MSSPDSETDRQPTKPTKQPVGWGLWRKLMLAGALVLLANAVAYALIDPDPHRAIGCRGELDRLHPSCSGLRSADARTAEELRSVTRRVRG